MNENSNLEQLKKEKKFLRFSRNFDIVTAGCGSVYAGLCLLIAKNGYFLDLNNYIHLKEIIGLSSFTFMSAITAQFIEEASIKNSEYQKVLERIKN